LIEDRKTRFVGNRINGSGTILILGGEVNANVTTNGYHIQATGTYLQGNIGQLVVGHNYSGTRLPAITTKVDSHAGSIQLKNQSGTQLPR
jgi:hypothetical protein